MPMHLLRAALTTGSSFSHLSCAASASVACFLAAGRSVPMHLLRAALTVGSSFSHLSWAASAALQGV